MKKLTLFKGKAMAYLVLMCLFLAQGCRKDPVLTKNPEVLKSLVNDKAIDKWYSDNQISQVIPIDWQKARQATIDGKHIVRVPTLNTDRFKLALQAKTALKQNMLNSNGPITNTKGKISLEQNPIIDDPGNGRGNTNFFTNHPPEVYFIQDPVTTKMQTFLMNFIPDNEGTGFGQNGNWTGKLYEWNTSSDTVLVQTFVNNILTDRSVSIFLKVDENGAISLAKPQKLQSLGSIKEKQVSGIFGWLADKILDGFGAIGYIFGLTELVPSTGSSTGHHNHYRFISHPGSSSGSEWNDTGDAGSQYLSMGLPMVGSYLGGMDSGMSLVEITYSRYDYSGANSGPNNNEVPNADGIYVLEHLTLSPAAQDYILTIEAAPLATRIRDYLNANGYTIDNKAFASWAIEYMTENRNVSFTDFQNQFIPSVQVVADPNADNWSDPDNEILNDLDQTVYQQYQDNQPWPTINRVIEFKQFVPIRWITRPDGSKYTVNCLVLAKEQLAKVGYTCSGYLPGTQTFQTYKESTGVDLVETKKAISYIITSLTNKIPVLIGVDNRSGTPSTSNLDGSTDHFVVIVAMGTDSNGKYFLFMDSATNFISYGASFSNKLYFNSNTGKITGKTAIEAYSNQPGMHDYIVTQVRKSIKK